LSYLNNSQRDQILRLEDSEEDLELE